MNAPDLPPLPTIDELMGLLIQPAIGWGKIRASTIAYGDAREAAAVLAERERVVKTIGDHIEGKLHAWRQSAMNKSGDRLAFGDFMGDDSIDDLVDFVCDQWALDAAIRAEKKEQT